MKIKQLSTNGYQLLDIFEPNLYAKIKLTIDSFIPVEENWPAGDSPELKSLKPTARREVFSLFNEKDMRSEIINSLKLLEIPNKLNAIMLWRDYLGYRNLLHRDPYPVQHVCIIYFGDHHNNDMGTAYYENNTEYIVPYRSNSGILLKNSCDIDHRMFGEVSIDCRKSLYINWKPDERA